MKTFRELFREKDGLNEVKSKTTLSSMDEVRELITEAKTELNPKPKNFKEFLSNMRKQISFISVDDGSYRGVLELSLELKTEDKVSLYYLVLSSSSTSRPNIMCYDMDTDLIKHLTDVKVEMTGNLNSIGTLWLSESQTVEIMKLYKKIFQTNAKIKSQIKKMWEVDYYRYTNIFELFNKAGISDISKNAFKF